MKPFVVILAVLGAASCASTSSSSTRPSSVQATATGTIAQIYYWRAKPGKYDEYTRYVRDVAEPIDAEAHRRGAFLSVTTYMTQDTASQWTHMRVFILRDSAQLRGLSAALDSAGMRLGRTASSVVSAVNTRLLSAIELARQRWGSCAGNPTSTPVTRITRIRRMTPMNFHGAGRATLGDA